MRLDDNEIMEAIAGKYAKKKALIVLGGASAAKWEVLRDEIKPDVLIGVNGVNAVINNLDFWLCVENLCHTFKLAKEGNQRSIFIAQMYSRTGAKIRLVNFKSHSYIQNKSNLIRIQRYGIDDPDEPGNFSFRRYGGGLLTGGIFEDKEKVRVALRTGTVGLQALHLAGLLGCAEVHTIGFDLCFKGDHHFYTYPSYETDDIWNKSAFTTYKGLSTLYWWIETAKYLRHIEPLLNRDGIDWIDHSSGLLQMEGIAL